MRSSCAHNLEAAGLNNRIEHFRDGQAALDFFYAQGPGPRAVKGASYLLLLDVRMPKVDGIESATRNYGSHWHTDQAPREVPVMGTMLVCRQSPPAGGDTMFINMSVAFEALSEGLKQTLRGMRALHSNVQ